MFFTAVIPFDKANILQVVGMSILIACIIALLAALTEAKQALWRKAFESLAERFTSIKCAVFDCN